VYAVGDVFAKFRELLSHISCFDDLGKFGGNDGQNARRTHPDSPTKTEFDQRAHHAREQSKEAKPT
jgi:hypothetical protein